MFIRQTTPDFETLIASTDKCLGGTSQKYLFGITKLEFRFFRPWPWLFRIFISEYLFQNIYFIFSQITSPGAGKLVLGERRGIPDF